jgi:hypothetical protein
MSFYIIKNDFVIILLHHIMINKQNYRRVPILRVRILNNIDNVLYDVERYLVDILLCITMFIIFMVLRYFIIFIIINIK